MQSTSLNEYDYRVEGSLVPNSVVLPLTYRITDTLTLRPAASRASLLVDGSPSVITRAALTTPFLAPRCNRNWSSMTISNACTVFVEPSRWERGLIVYVG